MENGKIEKNEQQTIFRLNTEILQLRQKLSALEAKKSHAAFDAFNQKLKRVTTSDSDLKKLTLEVQKLSGLREELNKQLILEREEVAKIKTENSRLQDENMLLKTKVQEVSEQCNELRLRVNEANEAMDELYFDEELTRHRLGDSSNTYSTPSSPANLSTHFSSIPPPPPPTLLPTIDFSASSPISSILQPLSSTPLSFQNPIASSLSPSSSSPPIPTSPQSRTSASLSPPKKRIPPPPPSLPPPTEPISALPPHSEESKTSKDSSSPKSSKTNRSQTSDWQNPSLNDPSNMSSLHRLNKMIEKNAKKLLSKAKPSQRQQPIQSFPSALQLETILYNQQEEMAKSLLANRASSVNLSTTETKESSASAVEHTRALFPPPPPRSPICSSKINSLPVPSSPRLRMDASHTASSLTDSLPIASIAVNIHQSSPILLKEELSASLLPGSSDTVEQAPPPQMDESFASVVENDWASGMEDFSVAIPSAAAGEAKNYHDVVEIIDSPSPLVTSELLMKKTITNIKAPVISGTFSPYKTNGGEKRIMTRSQARTHSPSSLPIEIQTELIKELPVKGKREREMSVVSVDELTSKEPFRKAKRQEVEDIEDGEIVEDVDIAFEEHDLQEKKKNKNFTPRILKKMEFLKKRKTLMESVSHVKKRPCEIFKRGKCESGDLCPYSHDEEVLKNEKTVPCRFLINGHCGKGDVCLFSHDIGNEYCRSYLAVGICARKPCPCSHEMINDVDKAIQYVNTHKAYLLDIYKRHYGMPMLDHFWWKTLLEQTQSDLDFTPSS